MASGIVDPLPCRVFALRWLLLVTACAGPSPGKPAAAPSHDSGDRPEPVDPTVLCADPGARTRDGWYDPLTLPGTPADAHRFWGAGVAADDLDGDGDLDLVTVDGSGPRVWLLDERQYTLAAWFPERDWTRAAAASIADVDDDGRLDVLITRYEHSDLLFRSTGDRFELIGELGSDEGSQGAAWWDWDGDGDLDAVIAGHGDTVVVEDNLPADPTQLLRNEDGRLVPASGLPDRANDAYTFVAAWIDVDSDRRPELYLANDFPIYRTGQLLHQVDGAFRIDDGSTGLNATIAGMGLGLADVDGDGLEDVLLTGWDRMMLLESGGGAPWIDASAARGIREVPREEPHVGWGAELADVDADGDLDAVVLFGHLDTVRDEMLSRAVSTYNPPAQHDALWLRDGEAFVELAAAHGVDDPGAHRGLVVADLDRDGWLDLVKRDLDGPTRIHWARCGEAAWLIVRLAQPAPNVDAVGATIRVHTDASVQTRVIRRGGTGLVSSGPAEAHFGLGGRESVTVEVTWPDGTITEISEVSARQVLTVSR